MSTIGPEHEAPQARGDGASDAVTYAFGDAANRIYGLARAGIVPGDPPTRSGMGMLFDGTDPIAVRAEGAVSEDAPAGVSTEVLEPLRRWRVALEDTFDLEVEALSPPAVLDPKGAVAKQGGMQGYEQLCRFRGTAGGRQIDCLGQRGHSWGAADWSKIALTRTISAWLDTETAVTVTAIRPRSVDHHGGESVAATIFHGGTPVEVGEPLVSTLYDGDGRQRHVGLELWVDPDGYPVRAAGEVVCGSTLDLGRLQLDVAFFAWRMEGRAGIGRYDVLRRSDPA